MPVAFAAALEKELTVDIEDAYGQIAWGFSHARQGGGNHEAVDDRRFRASHLSSVFGGVD
jgi:hypothetical protein